MLKLIITIELLAGFYTLSVEDNYIITAYHNPETFEVSVISVIDMKKDSIYFMEHNQVTKVLALDEMPRGSDNLKRIKTHKKNQTQDIAGYKCEIYNDEHFMTNYPKEYDKTTVKSQRFVSDIDIINKYIPNEKYRARLPFIGSDYIQSKKYTLKKIEITHKIPTLISEVSKIEEVEKIKP